MKKNLRFLLVLAIGWLTSTGAFALEQVDGVYQIGSAQDFKEFAAVVNSDGRQHKLNAVVTQDFTLDELVMVGAPSNAYSGTFDGQGHTVTIDFTMETGGQDGECGLFRRINGATIKNLKVAGSITTKGQLAGGVVSGIWQTAVVENCVSTVTITDTQSGDGTHGGIVARVSDKGGANAIIIRNCAFLGTIEASGRTGSGGILGWPDNAGGGQVVIENCLMAGTLNLATGQDNDVIVRNSATVTNCYYVALQGMNNSKNATLATAEQLASGELCFLLNGSQSATPAWFQTIGTDAMPLPMGTAVVYANGSLNCDGTPKGDVTYSNTFTEPLRDDHQWNDWGFCSVCDEIQPDFLKADENGFYPIATKQDYNWFMMMVNSKGQPNINGKLTQDLDLSDYTFIPIGVDMRNYAGTFDGQGHRIKNMTIDGTKKEQGFFSTCQGGAVIKNLIIDSSCKMVGTGGSNVAALIGCVNHNNYNNDVVLIQNVGNEMSFNCSTTNNAGFIARDFSSFLNVKIENCYNTGNIMGGTENGAFTAWTPRVTLTNCWNTGRIEKTGNYNGSKSLARGNQPQFINSYDLNSENTDNAGAPEGYAAEWLASGKMAYLLNGNKSTDVAWYQVIGTDAYPYPFGTAVVYANGDLKCDGMTPKEGSELTFSNTEGSNVDAHQFNDWGFCSVCDALNPDFMTPNGNGQFELGTDKQLNWFAHYATKVNAAANAVLTANIDMKDVNGFPGIGTPTSKYTGTFDGQKHVISNLTIDNQSTGNPAGFFNNVTAGAVIKNFTLDNTCYIVGHHFVGAFVGQTDGNGTVLLQQLGNEADVMAWEQNAGGIVGCNTSGELKLTLENCYNTGAISSARESGAVSGWLGNDAKVINCYNMGSVLGENSESFARGNSIQTTNCFNVDAWKDLPATPIEDFTNGTVLAKLQEAAPYVWYSSAEEDGHPVLYVTEWGAQQRTPYAGIAVQDGDFYLYNVETGYWLQNNNRQTVDWNSHAELDPVGYAFGLKAIEGGWQIDPKMGNNHSLNAGNLYMDTGDAMTTWTFEPVEAEGVSNAYTIKSGDVVLGASNDKFLQKTTNNSIWQIVTKEERLAVMQAEYPNAKGTAPVDLSWLIPGGDFNIAHETAMQLNGTTGIEAGAAFVSGQTQGNGVREIWNNATGYDINYTLNDLPDGIYRFTVSGYYRDGKTTDIGAKHKNGTEELRAIVYANDQEQPLMSVVAPERTASGQGCNVNTSGYFVPDNIGDAAIATREGIYVNTPIEVNLTGGTLKIGVRKEGGADGDWTILDYFKVQYFGPESLDLYLSLLQNAINEAEAFDASVTSDALAAELTTAINEAKAALNATTKEDITAATNQLNTVLAAAKSVNVTALKQTVALAKEEGLNTAAGETAIVEAKNASEIEQPLYDLRAARKLNAMRMPDIYTGSKPAEGKVYLFNVGTGTFLGTGSDWNTHAAVDQAGIEIELVNVNNEEYTFKFKTGRGGGWMAYNGYVDTNGQDFWHFMPVEGKEGVYNISSTGNDGFLLGYDPNGGTDGKKYWNTIAIDRTGVDNPMNQWKVITPAEREALLAKATEGDPVDVSYLIKNASLNRQDGYDMWEKLCDGGNGGARVSTVTDSNNDRAADYAYEYFEPNSFSFTQTIEGLTPGKYEVSVQGFFRNGNGGAQAEAYNNGEELKQLAYLVANDQTALLPNIASVLSKVPGIGDLQACKDGEFPNMPQSAIEYFETGYYKTTLPVTVGEDGTLTLGVKKDSKELNGDWVVIDNFRLRYLGDNSIKTMSILGDFTGGWEMEKAADMTQSTENPAIWTLHVEDFEVKFEEGQTERTYEYKATANHAWGVYELPALGNQNWVFGETRDYKAGVYDLDFTVDTENHTLTLVPTFDEVATAISEMKADAKQAPVYNLNGQKVEKAQKGLYIIGGKKVVRK
ncbi:MAG: FIVAR domain-containing protein [Prevotella sp.]|nr:FIVAR domain-containing protein [Prevotella sp.]